MKKYASNYIGKPGTMTPFIQQYKDQFKDAHRAAETDPRKTKVTGVSFGSHETGRNLVCRLLLEKKKKTTTNIK